MYKTWNRLPEKGALWMYGSYALACVLFGTCAFVLYLFDGPDSRPDYYLTCNRSTGGVPDTDRMFSERLLTRNAWKLTNNRWEMVVNRTKLTTHRTSSGGCFPVSLSPVQKHSSNILSIAHALYFSFTLYLSVTRMVMSVN